MLWETFSKIVDFSDSHYVLKLCLRGYLRVGEKITQSYIFIFSQYFLLI